MNRGDKRWILIEVPSKKGIKKFKQEIEPWIELIAMTMDEWDDEDYKKIKISNKSDRQISIRRLKQLEYDNECLIEDKNNYIKEIQNIKKNVQQINHMFFSLLEYFNEKIENQQADYYDNYGKLKFPYSFKSIFETKTGSGHGPSCRLVIDKKTKQNYIDIGKTRMTMSNWQEFLKFVLKINEYFKLKMDGSVHR